MTLLGRTLGRLRAVRRDVRGMMAVEFALIMPVMMTIFFGSIEITDYVLAKRRVGMATSMLGDLVTNRGEDYIHRDELAAIFRISERVLEPYGIDDVTVNVTAVTWDETKKKPVVAWSKQRKPNGQVKNNDDPGYKRNDVFVPLADKDYQVGDETLVSAGQHLIVAEMKYPFESSLSNVVFDKFTINVQEVRSPRRNFSMRHCNNNKCTDGTKWDKNKKEPKDKAK